MFLLDTNVVSELRKLGDGKADARVVAWVVRRDAASFFISALTLMELEIGILRIERRNAGQGQLLRTWMARHVLPEFAERTLPVDSAVALKCARLHVPDRRAERDALIAATAIVHGMTVVTRNVTDFETTGSGGRRSGGRSMTLLCTSSALNATPPDCRLATPCGRVPTPHHRPFEPNVEGRVEIASRSFVVDENGKRTAVVLPIGEYERLLEDLEDLAVIAQRRNEPTESLANVVEAAGREVAARIVRVSRSADKDLARVGYRNWPTSRNGTPSTVVPRTMIQQQ